jgi:CheY-like chemotaxis protein
MNGTPKAKSRPATAARILVVEDQDSIREFTRTVLTAAGHDVVVAINGAEAVAAARAARFDLILMDVQMPVMDGLTAARDIRALGGLHARVPIIAISGDMKSSGTGDMDDQICKPFRKAELLLKVDAWLKGDLASPPVGQPKESGEAAFNDACELMGRPWALRGLTKLKEQIDEAFGADPAQNDGRLARQAHALVSLTAILGFSTLSDLCSTLEEACRNGDDVRPPFQSARAAAATARESAIGLIVDLQSENGLVQPA